MWIERFNRARLPLPGLCLVLLVFSAVTLPGVEPTNNLSRDEQYRQTVLGVWQDHYQGKRTMTIRSDGTATMVVELSGAKAALFARRLVFEMQWSIENGRLAKRTIGGQPKGKVAFILRTMGDRVNEPILELTEERMRLQDADGKTEYTWRRMSAGPPAS